MDIKEILQATQGPNQLPAKPDGPSEVVPLNYGGLDKVGAEPAPADVTAQQGAGSSSGGLTPGAQGVAGDGTVKSGNDDGYSTQSGPPVLPAGQGLGVLTPGHDGRPEGGQTLPGEKPGAAKDPRLSAGGGTGAGLNPALGKMPKTPPGSFGPPSV